MLIIPTPTIGCDWPGCKDPDCPFPNGKPGGKRH